MSFESPDVLCLQEIKANVEDLDDIIVSPFDYKSYFFSAERKGYSGTAIYTKTKPDNVHLGMGAKEFDKEGRTLRVDFNNVSIINNYFPNSQRDQERLGYKLEFCAALQEYCDNLVKKGRDLIICGDYNIAHKEIDLANPKTNTKTSGFLPQERDWMDKFVGSGYVDTFRHFCPEPGHYTWWSNRPGVRERNIGWRIDYHCVNESFLPQIESCTLMPDVLGSDHCPVVLQANI